MFILCGTAAAVIITLLQCLAFYRKDKALNYAHIFVRNEIVINLVSLALLKYVFKYQHILVTDAYGKASFVKFFALSLVVGVLYALLNATLDGRLLFEKTKIKNTAGAWIVRILSVFFTALGCACYFATNWSRESFGEISGDQLLINLLSPTSDADSAVYVDCFEGPVFNTLLITVIVSLLIFSTFKIIINNNNKVKTVFNDLARRIISLVLSLAILASGGVYLFNGLKLKDVYYSYVLKSDMIEEYFCDPQEVEIVFPEKKRNVIHIYLESMENSYLSKDLGGYMDNNLMPELAALADEGVVFSDNDTKFGGPQLATGTQWSIASMVNQAAGIPMKTPDQPNRYGSEGNFLPGAYTLYDMLKEQGYEQTVMFGASAGYGGLRYFFETHGDIKIFDSHYARNNGFIPKDYNVWWGYEDDKLYEFAKEEITRLYQTGNPFCFTMETADTHRPHGYLSKNAPTPYDDQYSNVIAYSSTLAYDFVKWIQAQPFYENTTIILIGDHLSMDTDFFEDFDKDYVRTQYNLIINPAQDINTIDKSVFVNRKYANFDLFPTILSSMGVKIEGNRLGVGTDLFSGDPTIIEELGLDYVNNELLKKSEFYNDKILQGNTLPQSQDTKKK